MTATKTPMKKSPKKEQEIVVATGHFVTNTSVGLVFKDTPTFEQWEQILHFQLGLRDRSNWWIGDALNYGEAKYGEKYAQAIEITGNELSTLTNNAYVCRAFEISRRRENLSFGHHAAAAGLPPQEADRILLQAERERWTRQDVRDAVCRINGTPTKAEREATKQVTGRVTKSRTRKPVIEAQATTQPAPTTPPPQPTPEPTPSETSEAAAERHLKAFCDAIPQVEWQNMSTLRKKTWLKLLIPVDALIDDLTK